MKGYITPGDPLPLDGAYLTIAASPLECGEDPASCDCGFHENMREAEASHGEGEQLAITEIPPPPPPPPEEYMRVQLREAHAILSRLSTSFGQSLPNNVYMALAYLHIEIVNGGNHAQGK